MFEKIVIALILVLAAVLVFSGCSDILHKADQLEDAVEDKVDQLEDAVEDRLDAAAGKWGDADPTDKTPPHHTQENTEAVPHHEKPTEAVTKTEKETAAEVDIETTADPVQSSLDKIIGIVGDAVKEQASSVDGATAAAQDEFITAEAAKQIALDHAGVAASDAIFDRTERDYDNGVWHYEVEFRVGRSEYEYDIDAVTGNILSFDKDR